MSILNKIKEAKNEFVTGFKSGYKEVTEKGIRVTSINGVPVDNTPSTVSGKTGTKIGVIIGMLNTFMKSATARMIMKVLGITAGITAAIVNMVLVGTVGNILLVVVPLLVMSAYGITNVFNVRMPVWMQIIVAFNSGGVLFLAVVGILGNLLIGNLLMSLLCVALYAVPFMVFVK